MIRKLKSGEYRLYSRKKDPKTGKRRNLKRSVRGRAPRSTSEPSSSSSATEYGGLGRRRPRTRSIRTSTMVSSSRIGTPHWSRS